MLKATVSGSFHRHMSKIYESVGTLNDAGVEVLSPADPRIVDHHGEFLFVASDRLRSIRLVQDRHFACISASDFLLLVAPDGYVGSSAAMEIGAAVAAGVKIFCESEVSDLTLKHYVRKVIDIEDCVKIMSNRENMDSRSPHFLVDPIESISRTHEILERLGQQFVAPIQTDSGFVERNISSARFEFTRIFGSHLFK